MKTHETERLGGWVRRFLVEYLVVERNLSRNTQRSYRDTFRLLIPFATDVNKTTVDRLAVAEVSADLVRRFLRHVEEQRGCGVRTRNQRLAAGGHPRVRQLRRGALPRVDSLVRRGPCGAVQTL